MVLFNNFGCFNWNQYYLGLTLRVWVDIYGSYLVAKNSCVSLSASSFFSF